MQSILDGKMIIRVSASILGLDYSDQTAIDQAVLRITNANYVHFDIADGKFVKEKSFGSDVVARTSLSGTKLEKDVHLMVKDPEKEVDKYLEAGADMISFHAEASKAPDKLLGKIRAAGVQAGLAISPSTTLKSIEKYLDNLDFVLIMTVKPGKPGQKLLKTTIKKVASLRKKRPHLDIEVDGGINAGNAGELIDAGATILVSGSYIFNSEDPKIAIDLLRNA
ncbi:ribulose-phosphate 3-epimerase [Candidatus Woesearchaeota archaeon]|nr:ribulose-phosphate 3-epimerase [Candidatus Woesearchaeota archaeon]